MPRPLALALCLSLPTAATAEPISTPPCPEASHWEQALHVGQTSMVFGADPDFPLLSTYGLLRNDAAHAFENPVIEVRYLDEDGQMVDTLVHAAFGLVVPARGEASFRVQGTPAQDYGRYAGHAVSLTRAGAAIDCVPDAALDGADGGPDHSTWIMLALALLALGLSALALARRRAEPMGLDADALQPLIALLDRQADAQQRLALAIDQLSQSRPPTPGSEADRTD